VAEPPGGAWRRQGPAHVVLGAGRGAGHRRRLPRRAPVHGAARRGGGADPGRGL